MMNIKLEFLGMDSWSRPVYEDENGRLWKDVDPRKVSVPDLCTSMNNAFDGEPDTPMSVIKAYSEANVEFTPKRVTWD